MKEQQSLRMSQLCQDLNLTLIELDEKQKDVARLKEQVRLLRLEISRRGGKGF
jgi:polyhydroxyalkanoate synthesis regulator phasin